MKYFYKDIELDVPETVYCPREDSELLAKVLESTPLKDKRVLEIGCGSGLLSILMSKKGAHVTAVDINEDAVEITKINAERNDTKISALVSDMFEKVKGRFDLIVFNPPYLPIGEDDVEDVTYSGGSSGREIIEIFLDTAPEYLNMAGNLIFAISSLTDEGEVLHLIKEAGLHPRIIARQKIPWEELIVVEAHLQLGIIPIKDF